MPGPLIYQTSSNLRLIHQEFCQELKNELENAPLPSSSNLSTYFRSPSRSVLFRETSTTLGHLQGNSQKCQITLTPQVLSLIFLNRTLHIIIEDIRLLQMDEFKKILQIYAANVPENPPIIIENFPPKRLEKFLLILSYLMARPKQKLVYCFSWNFALKRQKKPEILGVYPVTLTVESHIQTEAMRCQIEYKIQDLVHDEVSKAEK